MKKLLALLLLLLPLSLPAQQINSAGGNLTAASASCLSTNCLSIRLYVGTGTVSVTLSGTFSATASFEQSGDFGSTWVAASPATATSTGTTQFSVAALTNFRVRVSTYVSGTVAATIISSTASSGASGNISPTGISSSTAGVFTNSVMNEPFLYTTTGGGTCSTANILAQTGSQSVFLTDDIAACLNIPSSGVTNGFSNGFGSYVLNNNSSATGFFGWVGGVGFYSQVGCIAGGSAHCWGANLSVYDLATKPAVLFGNEYDITINNTTTTGAGTIYSVRGTAQPTGDNFPGVAFQGGGGTGRFTAGFECQNASVASAATNAYACVNLGQQETGSGQDSQRIFFNAAHGATPISANINLIQDNVMFLGARAVAIVSSPAAGNEASYGITLKVTAGLSQNQLVKIDTANTDSVVVCTTADTVCHGFVQADTVYCSLAAQQFCAIATMPGSKVTGILGTGTCAIGNFVIVDTTTNGRIKCTAVQPGVGAFIGLALSAQATVGSTVDILTKFQ